MSTEIAQDINTTSINGPLFMNSGKRKFILLVDISGSVDCNFSQNIKVFDKMAEVAGGLDLDEGWIVFWSSPSFNAGRCVKGTMSLPFVVKGSTLHTAFAAGATGIGGGTCPPIGFRAINPDWFKHNPMVYLFTDGQIGCSEMNDLANKNALADEIRKLPTDLTIIAVEAKTRDFRVLRMLIAPLVVISIRLFKIITLHLKLVSLYLFVEMEHLHRSIV